MALIFVDDLRPGMVLAEDLYTPKKRFLLGAGAVLQPEHLGHLKSWGVVEAQICEESLGADFQPSTVLDDASLDLAESFLLRRFALMDLSREPLATLYRHAVQRCAERLQGGWDPPILTVDALSTHRAGLTPPSPAQYIHGDLGLVTLPNVYSRILEVLHQPNASTAQVAEVVGKDASLTVKILKLVNSPLYGFGGKIDSVNRAVALIGTNELLNLTLGIAVLRQFERIPGDLLDMDMFWRHSVRCGLYAKVFAEYARLEGKESYFTGGLLHDLGRLVMLARIPELYQEAIACGRRQSFPMYRAEQEVLKTDHSIVGKLIAERWRLPVNLLRMIGGHHSPGMGHYPVEACVLHIADIFAHACGNELNLVHDIPPLVPKAWETLGLPLEAIASAIRQVDRDFNDVLRIFHTDHQI